MSTRLGEAFSRSERFGVCLRRTLCVVLCGCWIAGCEGHNRAVIAGYYRGKTETELLRQVGAATRVVALDGKDRSRVCNTLPGGGAVRQLEYEDPEGLSAQFRKWQGKQPYAMGVVCVDKSGGIVRTFWIQF